MNEAAWRALDLIRAYAARDRAAAIEHLALLEPDQLEYTGGVLIAMYNDTRQVLHGTATVVRAVGSVPNAVCAHLCDRTDVIPYDRLEEFFTENLA